MPYVCMEPGEKKALGGKSRQGVVADLLTGLTSVVCRKSTSPHRSSDGCKTTKVICQNNVIDGEKWLYHKLV